MPFSEHSEEEIFLKCLELPAGDRQSFIETSCGENRSLRDSLIELIASYEETEGFMSALRDEDSAAVASRLHRVAPSDEGPGDLIGRYRLSEKIGEGSWGTVWIARQTEDIDRQVALKILKLGLDTKDFLVRFEAERQMLAMMDHPNIATIFDAGATDFGRPYLVMELVEGYPLLEYADENRLSIEERIELFIRICGALHHAHQKGIIHRDIKPSNILVAEGDDGPIPKVIDFGVAKTTEFRLGDQTQFTNIHTFIGTPLYCSPEQLELVGESVDERSDVYSLGAVLYELVVGRSHFDGQRLTALGLDGFRTIVKEKDPPLPSERFESVTSEERTDIARLRDSAVSKVGMQLKGDVDWIVMQCLEKDCDRRYRTATELADDLRAFIECRPVSAAAPSIAYRTKKFVRRNISKKAAWAIVPAALLCLVGLGLIIESGRRTPVDFVSPFAMALAEDNRSIAVLPFENLSASEADSYLADGLYGELTNALTRIKNIKTISRKSTIRYRDTTKSSSEIGEELGAITLLTGEVEKRGDQIRVSVQLIDAIDDRNLWGESYTTVFSAAGIFGIQSEISSAIALQLKTILVPEENERLSQVPTQNLEALEAYFKGNEILSNGNQVRMPEAVELFERAVELDAEFTLGYVGLALSYLNYGTPLNERSLSRDDYKKKVDERMGKMRTAANKAFALNFDLSEVQTLQGIVNRVEGDLDAAEASFKRAIEMNPNYADAYYRLGLLWDYRPTTLTYAGAVIRYAPDDQDPGTGALQYRIDSEAASLLSEAVELDPTNASYRQFYAYLLGSMGRLEEEVAQSKLALVHNPNQARLHKDLGVRLIWSVGRNDEALVHLRKSLALDPLEKGLNIDIATAFEFMGDFEEAARWTKKTMALDTRVAHLYEARLQEFRGEHELAMNSYRKILTDRGLRSNRGRMRVFFDDLRTGRYQEARARYFAAFPKLFEPDLSTYADSLPFVFAKVNFGVFAMEIAAILMATGETEQANRLMDETWRFYRFHPVASIKKFYETLILVSRGDNIRALEVLQGAFDEGFRDRFKFIDARLDPIRNEPEFITMMAVIDADLAKQLANVRRMEANGELAAIPKLREKDDSI